VQKCRAQEEHGEDYRSRKGGVVVVEDVFPVAVRHGEDRSLATMAFEMDRRGSEKEGVYMSEWDILGEIIRYEG
jgi:hypothetical protein